MKKILVTLTSAAILATASIADMVRIEAGVGAWMQTPTGTTAYTAGGVYKSGEDTTTDNYAWILVKHFVPMVPNLKLEYSSLTDAGTATGAFEGFIASGSMSYDITQYDIVPYYNILDNTFWTTIDLGIDVKVMDISYAAGVDSAHVSVALPLGYARVRVQAPATDFGVEADVKYLSFSNSKISDTKIKVDYTFSSVPLIQPAIEIGYRKQQILIDESSVDLKVDLEFSGPYIGIMARF